ncbi:MAG: hypothetical protein HXY20_05940 [Acidobacteria bacterium]|nr:hypothetical protein [Acidobacteriota bacterium]
MPSSPAPRVLQAASDRLGSKAIRKRLEYWILVLDPRFSRRERQEMGFRRFYAIAQIEYWRDFPSSTGWFRWCICAARER